MCFVNSVTIVWITCIKISQFPLEFNSLLNSSGNWLISLRQHKLHIFLLKKCCTKPISIFPTLQNLIFSYHICPLLHDIDEMQGSHFKYSAPAIIIAPNVIKVRYDALLYRSECVHLYNHPSNYTKNICQWQPGEL